jgi:hypothetical protein
LKLGLTYSLLFSLIISWLLMLLIDRKIKWLQTWSVHYQRSIYQLGDSHAINRLYLRRQ